MAILVNIQLGLFTSCKYIDWTLICKIFQLQDNYHFANYCYILSGGTSILPRPDAADPEMIPEATNVQRYPVGMNRNLNPIYC